jgi:RNA polymerase sigma-70 factor (ECF subfamily)
MGATEIRDQEQPQAAKPATLGDVLYSGGALPLERERAWVALLHLVAKRDQQALHALYERTHRLVYTLILRITRSVEAAEELTLQVFYDVWSNSPPYDAAQGTVLAWIMNQARDKAVTRLKNSPAGARDAAAELRFDEQHRLLRAALQNLTPQERDAIESAYFSDLTHDLSKQSPGSWIRSGLVKLRQALAGNS